MCDVIIWHLSFKVCSLMKNFTVIVNWSWLVIGRSISCRQPNYMWCFHVILNVFFFDWTKNTQIKWKINTSYRELGALPVNQCRGFLSHCMVCFSFYRAVHSPAFFLLSFSFLFSCSLLVFGACILCCQQHIYHAMWHWLWLSRPVTGKGHRACMFISCL